MSPFNPCRLLPALVVMMATIVSATGAEQTLPNQQQEQVIFEQAQPCFFPEEYRGEYVVQLTPETENSKHSFNFRRVLVGADSVVPIASPPERGPSTENGGPPPNLPNGGGQDGTTTRATDPFWSARGGGGGRCHGRITPDSDDFIFVVPPRGTGYDEAPEWTDCIPPASISYAVAARCLTVRWLSQFVMVIRLGPPAGIRAGSKNGTRRGNNGAPRQPCSPEDAEPVATTCPSSAGPLFGQTADGGDTTDEGDTFAILYKVNIPPAQPKRQRNKSRNSGQQDNCPPMGGGGKYDVTVIGDPQRHRLRGGCAARACGPSDGGSGTATGFFDLWMGSSAIDDCSSSTLTGSGTGPQPPPTPAALAGGAGLYQFECLANWAAAQMDDDEIIMDSATGNGRMIGARFGGKAKTRYLRYVALYDRAAVNGTTDGKRPSYRCALYEVVGLVENAGGATGTSAHKKTRPASTIRMAISGDSRCAGLYSWMKGDQLTINHPRKFDNHDGNVANDESPPLMLLWSRAKESPVRKKTSTGAPLMPPMPPFISGEGCRFPDWAQGRWLDLRVEGGGARYVYYADTDGHDGADDYDGPETGSSTSKKPPRSSRRFLGLATALLPVHGNPDEDTVPPQTPAGPVKFAWRCVMRSGVDEHNDGIYDAKFLTYGGNTLNNYLGDDDGDEVDADIKCDNDKKKQRPRPDHQDDTSVLSFGCMWFKRHGPNVIEFTMLGLENSAPRTTAELNELGLTLCQEGRSKTDDDIPNWITETRPNDQDLVSIPCPVPVGLVFYGVVPAPPFAQQSKDTSYVSPPLTPHQPQSQLCARLAAANCEIVGAKPTSDHMRYTVSECVFDQNKKPKVPAIIYEASTTRAEGGLGKQHRWRPTTVTDFGNASGGDRRRVRRENVQSTINTTEDPSSSASSSMTSSSSESFSATVWPSSSSAKTSETSESTSSVEEYRTTTAERLRNFTINGKSTAMAKDVDEFTAQRNTSPSTSQTTTTATDAIPTINSSTQRPANNDQSSRTLSASSSSPAPYSNEYSTHQGTRLTDQGAHSTNEGTAATNGNYNFQGQTPIQRLSDSNNRYKNHDDFRTRSTSSPPLPSSSNGHSTNLGSTTTNQGTSTTNGDHNFQRQFPPQRQPLPDSNNRYEDYDYRTSAVPVNDFNHFHHGQQYPPPSPRNNNYYNRQLPTSPARPPVDDYNHDRRRPSPSVASTSPPPSSSTDHNNYQTYHRHQYQNQQPWSDAVNYYDRQYQQQRTSAGNERRTTSIEDHYYRQRQQPHFTQQQVGGGYTQPQVGGYMQQQVEGYPFMSAVTSWRNSTVGYGNYPPTTTNRPASWNTTTMADSDGWSVHSNRMVYVNGGNSDGLNDRSNNNIPVLWNTTTVGSRQNARGGIISLPPIQLPPLKDQTVTATTTVFGPSTLPLPQNHHRTQQNQYQPQTQSYQNRYQQPQYQQRPAFGPLPKSTPTADSTRSWPAKQPTPTRKIIGLRPKSESSYYREREYQCLGQWQEEPIWELEEAELKMLPIPAGPLTYTFVRRLDVDASVSSPNAIYECFVGTTMPDLQTDEVTLVLTEAGTGNKCSRLANPYRSGMRLKVNCTVSECNDTEGLQYHHHYPQKGAVNSEGYWHSSPPVAVQPPHPSVTGRPPWRASSSTTTSRQQQPNRGKQQTTNGARVTIAVNAATIAIATVVVALVNGVCRL